MKISELPYWAEKYVKHLYTHRPKMYKELRKSKELEALALSIQDSANASYESLYASYLANGYNQTTADIYAEGEVMRQYILLPSEQDVPVLGEEPEDFPEEPDED